MTVDQAMKIASAVSLQFKAFAHMQTLTGKVPSLEAMRPIVTAAVYEMALATDLPPLAPPIESRLRDAALQGVMQVLRSGRDFATASGLRADVQIAIDLLTAAGIVYQERGESLIDVDDVAWTDVGTLAPEPSSWLLYRTDAQSQAIIVLTDDEAREVAAHLDLLRGHTP